MDISDPATWECIDCGSPRHRWCGGKCHRCGRPRQQPYPVRLCDDCADQIAERQHDDRDTDAT